MALDCSSEVSNDYYGIGVRLGIYLVWLTSYLANTFLPDEISGALDANAIFLLALLVSIFRGTIIHGGEQLRYIDGLVLMQLCSGYMFGCFSMWGYRTVHYQNEGRRGIRHFGRFGTHFRLVLATAISAYGIWFWIEGVQDGLAWIYYTEGPESGQKKSECYPLVTFFFGKLDVTGGIRIFYIIVTLGCTAYYGLMLAVAGVERTLRLFGSKLVLARVPHETGLNDKELHYLFLFCRVGNLLWMIFSAIMVEMTLNWNHVTAVIGLNGKVLTPSQILPFLIGALGCIRVIYLICVDRWPGKKGDEEDAPSPDPLSVEKAAAAADADTLSSHGNDARPLWVRYLVAWLPWLSKSVLWRRSGDNASSNKPHGTVRDDSAPLMAKSPATPAFPQSPLVFHGEGKTNQLVSYSPTSPNAQ